MALISDPMQVKLIPHEAWDPYATIPGWVEHDQYMVFVHSEGLRHRNAACRLMVGWIGKQAGANFCPTNEFYYFTYPHQQWIAAEAKRLHGAASLEPHVEVPPHEDFSQSEEEAPQTEE